MSTSTSTKTFGNAFDDVDETELLAARTVGTATSARGTGSPVPTPTIAVGVARHFRPRRDRPTRPVVMKVALASRTPPPTASTPPRTRRGRTQWRRSLVARAGVGGPDDPAVIQPLIPRHLDSGADASSSASSSASTSSSSSSSTPASLGRRVLLSSAAASLGAGVVGANVPTFDAAANAPAWTCRCGGCARAMTAIVDADPILLAEFDRQRNAKQDVLFAKGMNGGMGGYESAVAARKNDLFEDVFASLPKGSNVEATVVEVGMGTFPNARYYFDGGRRGGRKLDIVGVDPNDAMESFARSNLAKANEAFGGGGGEDASLRIVHGVAEALPLKDNSADAVVCTLTLCSVLDQVAAVSEIKRILKPGAPFMFIEHVLSEDDPRLAAQQISLNGMQVAMADGCHLDRKTLDVIDAAGFASVRSERFTLPGFGLISSQVAGIAIV